jgi:hypothetical protein
MKRIKQALKRFIINAIVEDYRNNGRMRQLITEGRAATDEEDHASDVSLLFRFRGNDA